MINFTKYVLLFVIVITTQTYSTAQTLTSKVLDSTTQNPIPYANIILNKKGVITNEEGRFSFILDKNIKETDSLFISCMGFESVGKPLSEFTGTTIYLKPLAIELKPVIVTNKQYSADEIIDLVKDSLEKNYNKDLSKKRLFFRNSDYSKLAKTNYTLVKSTIDEFNKKFLDSVISTIPASSSYFTEVLCDLYGNNDEENQKIKLIKASQLYDKNNEIGFTSMEKKFNDIIKANVKPNSYFKIKSGPLLGTKVEGEDFDNIFKTEVDSTNAAALKKEVEKKKKEEQEWKKNFSKYKREALGKMMQNLFYMDDSELNFINKSRKYHFEITDFTYIGEDAVYILDFKPKGSADYKGKIYVNSDDFAVMRIDYHNVKPLKKFSLLGVGMNQYLGKGKVFFAKGNSNKYELKYLEQESGVKVSLKRPLKIIEKNKHVRGRRKQNELSLKLDLAFSGRNKQEVIVFDTERITSTQYEQFQEKNTVSPVYMANYNPDFWSGYNIIEPNTAIKEFTSIEEEAK